MRETLVNQLMKRPDLDEFDFPKSPYFKKLIWITNKNVMIHRDSIGQANLLSPILMRSPMKECPDQSLSRGKNEGRFGAQPTRHSSDQTIIKHDFMEPLLNSASEETRIREHHLNFADSLYEKDEELESQENHQLSKLSFQDDFSLEDTQTEEEQKEVEIAEKILRDIL